MIVKTTTENATLVGSIVQPDSTALLHLGGDGPHLLFIAPRGMIPLALDRMLHLQYLGMVQNAAQTALGTDRSMHCQPISHCDKLPQSACSLKKLLPQQPQLRQGGWTCTGDWFQMGRTDLDSVAASHLGKPGSRRCHNSKRGKGLMGWVYGPHGKRPPSRPACVGLPCGRWVYDAPLRTDWQTWRTSPVPGD